MEPARRPPPLATSLGLLAACAATLAPLLGACRAPAAGDADARPGGEVPGVDGVPGVPARASEQQGPEPDPARLRDDVSWLAADAREGRRAGTPGEAEAADWIAARCASLGLAPAGDPGPSGEPTWFQAFEVDLPARDGGGSRVAAEVDGRRLAARDCVPLFCAEAGTALGPLVFAGYGIEREERSWDDWAGLEPQGAIVLLVRGAPRLPEAAEAAAAADPHAQASPHGAAAESGWGDTASIFYKVMEAKRRGARAVVLAPHPDDEGQPLLAFDAGQTARAGLPAVMIGAADAAALVPGYGELVRAADRGERVRAGDGLPAVEVVADVVRRRGTARNVLALLEGRARDRTVVLGAHFDHLGHGGIGSLAGGSAPAIHNGADDNASGTAVVLEVARLLAAGPPPEGDVLVALWSGEELGLLGSEHWGAQPTIPLGTVRCNLNFDMVGRAEGAGLDVLGAGSAAGLPELVEAAARRADLAPRVGASGQGFGGSDHQSFLAREIPALHFFSGLHPQYHTPADDAELFEAAGAARVARLALELVRSIQATEGLAWTPPPAPEVQPAPRGFTTWLGSRPEYGFPGPGVRLAGTSEGSPAQRAGLLAGDVLLRVGDVGIGAVGDLVYALQRYKPGDVVEVRYLREGEEQSVRLTLLTRAVE